MAGHPLRPATRRRLGEPLPHQLADRPRGTFPAHCCFPTRGMPLAQRMRYYPAVRPAIPHRWTGSSRVTHPFATDPCGPVRLACVKHAASVRPEPGSNSPREFDKSSVRTTDRDQSSGYMRSVSLTRTFSSNWFHRVRTHHDPCSIICQRAWSRQLSPGAHQCSSTTEQGQVRLNTSLTAASPLHLRGGNPS